MACPTMRSTYSACTCDTQVPLTHAHARPYTHALHLHMHSSRPTCARNAPTRTRHAPAMHNARRRASYVPARGHHTRVPTRHIPTGVPTTFLRTRGASSLLRTLNMHAACVQLRLRSQINNQRSQNIRMTGQYTLNSVNQKNWRNFFVAVRYSDENCIL